MESEAVKERLRSQIKEMIKSEKGEMACDICKEDSLVLWRIEELEKGRDEFKKELEKGRDEFRRSIKELRNTLSAQKSVLIATLTSAILTLLMIIAMFIAKIL